MLALACAVLASAALSVSVPAWAGSKEQAVRYYEDAVKRFNSIKGEYDAAVIQLKNALQEEPQHAACDGLDG